MKVVSWKWIRRGLWNCYVDGEYSGWSIVQNPMLRFYVFHNDTDTERYRFLLKDAKKVAETLMHNDAESVTKSLCPKPL